MQPVRLTAIPWFPALLSDSATELKPEESLINFFNRLINLDYQSERMEQKKYPVFPRESDFKK
jgi:hypothetical protein